MTAYKDIPLRIGVCGASGKTGAAILKKINSLPEQFKLAATFSSQNSLNELKALCKISDVIIDFSNPAIFYELLKYCELYKKALIIGTTGLNEEQVASMHVTANKIPVIYSANMSMGANLISSLVSKCAQVLSEEYDTEIIEYHHRYKKDAPSGTALALAKEIVEVKNLNLEENVIFARSRNGERKPGEIGIFSIRGGGMMGEHEVIFANGNEVIRISHQVLDRAAYADGALKAALWVYRRSPGLYSMKKILDV